MSENKEEKKGFWSTLFAPKQKSSCCCGSQIEIVPENTAKKETPACSCATSKDSDKKVIKVLGTGCSSCKALYTMVQEAVAQLGIDARVEKEEDLQKIMAYNVMSLPALVVEGTVVSKGKKLSLEQVKELLK